MAFFNILFFFPFSICNNFALIVPCDVLPAGTSSRVSLAQIPRICDCGRTATGKYTGQGK